MKKKQWASNEQPGVPTTALAADDAGDSRALMKGRAILPRTHCVNQVIGLA